jgi:endonuclease/exonuclease/phosphatase family metal-dependent hydrolase
MSRACDPWDCKCGRKNNRIDICGACQTFRSKGRVGSNGGSNSGPQREIGDWDCPNCHKLIFGSKSKCHKCGVTKTEATLRLQTQLHQQQSSSLGFGYGGTTTTSSLGSSSSSFGQPSVFGQGINNAAPSNSSSSSSTAYSSSQNLFGQQKQQQSSQKSPQYQGWFVPAALAVANHLLGNGLENGETAHFKSPGFVQQQDRLRSLPLRSSSLSSSNIEYMIPPPSLVVNNRHHHQKNVPEICVLQYNIDMALREEDYPETQWQNRYERVRELVLRSGADIVCLQELRTLPVNGKPQSPEAFLASIEGYHFVLQYRSPNPLAFAQAILYKADRFYEVNSAKRWLSPTPKKYSESWPTDAVFPHLRSSIVIGIQLALIDADEEALSSKLDEGHLSFWVFNTHFNCDEDVKTNSCIALQEIVQEVAGEEPFVLTGDFNFFPDKDGLFQHTLLREAGFRDLGVNAVTSQTRRPLTTTFIGYQHDKHRSRDVFASQSRLDHVFGSRHWHVQSTPLLITETMMPQFDNVGLAELTQPNSLPSDHLPLYVVLGGSPPPPPPSQRPVVIPAEKEVAQPLPSASPPSCDICSDEPQNRTLVPCGHAACVGCIDQWFAKQKKKICPFCRTEVTLVIPRYH